MHGVAILYVGIMRKPAWRLVYDKKWGRVEIGARTGI